MIAYPAHLVAARAGGVRGILHAQRCSRWCRFLLKSWDAAHRGTGEGSLEYCPPDERIPPTWWLGGLGACAVFCTAVLSPLMSLPAYEPAAAVVLALLVAVLAVRALGQTDLNPVSGVGKLSQARTSSACCLES